MRSGHVGTDNTDMSVELEKSPSRRWCNGSIEFLKLDVIQEELSDEEESFEPQSKIIKLDLPKNENPDHDTKLQ